MVAEHFGKTKVQLFAKKLNFIFLKNVAGYISKMLADVSRVVHDRRLLCEALCKFAVDCNRCVIRAGSAGSKTDKRDGENVPAPASLSYLY